MKKIIVSFIVVISIVSMVFILHAIRKEEDRVVENDVIEKSWSNLLAFAQENDSQISQVSQILLKYKDKISLDETPIDYETLIMDETEAVKEEFREVFQTVSFSYETITEKRDDVVYYYYNYEDRTSYGIVYFAKDGNDKQEVLSFMKEFGEVVQISDAIYAYHYQLKQT